MSSAPPARRELLLLLADAKEQPRDDRLRLVLADWLEDTGQPLDRARAELIRTQLPLPWLAPDDPERLEHESRARRLVNEHGRAWLGPAAPWLMGWSAVRGLWSVTVRASVLRGRAMSALAGTEAWAWVEELRLTEARPGDLGGLKSHPLLDGLTGLELIALDLRGEGAESLAALPWLRSVERLTLNGRPLDAAALRAILSSPHLGRLRELALGAASIDVMGAAALAAAPAAGRIEKLALWGNGLHGAATLALLHDASLPQLRHLDLRGNRVPDEAAYMFARARGLARLQFLDLSDNDIGDVGAVALAGSPYLDNVRSLLLWGNPVGPAGAARLRERFGPRVHLAPLPS